VWWQQEELSPVRNAFSLPCSTINTSSALSKAFNKSSLNLCSCFLLAYNTPPPFWGLYTTTLDELHLYSIVEKEAHVLGHVLFAVNFHRNCQMGIVFSVIFLYMLLIGNVLRSSKCQMLIWKSDSLPLPLDTSMTLLILDVFLNVSQPESMSSASVECFLYGCRVSSFKDSSDSECSAILFCFWPRTLYFPLSVCILSHVVPAFVWAFDFVPAMVFLVSAIITVTPLGLSQCHALIYCSVLPLSALLPLPDLSALAEISMFSSMFSYPTSVWYTWPLPLLAGHFSTPFLTPSCDSYLLIHACASHFLFLSYEFFCYLLSTTLHTHSAISMAYRSIRAFLWLNLRILQDHKLP